MTEKIHPKNGLLSGMFIVYTTAAIAVAAGLFWPGVNQFFGANPTTALINTFLVSILLMVAHKLESYFFREYDRCPVYLSSSGHAKWMKHPRQILFVAFVGTFLMLMIVINLVMRGPPWPLLLMAIWMAQGLHEIHHSAKTLVERRYYPGVISSIFFVAHIDVFMFLQWGELVLKGHEWVYYVYYGLQPVVFLAFVLEHRWWSMRRC